jgi:uncharacterized protein YcgI (DUF1989 family)
MENITISITGKNAERQASAIIRSFYKTMAKMEDGGCHIQLSTAHSTESADDLQIPDFVQERSKRAAGRWG